MTLELDTCVKGLALAPGCLLSANGGLACFTNQIQQRAIAIQGVVLNTGGISVSLALRTLQRPKVEHFPPEPGFPNGTTISDMGINWIEHDLVPPDMPQADKRHRIPAPADFELDGVYYLRAHLMQLVAVHVANPGKEPLEVYGVILYREIMKSPV